MADVGRPPMFKDPAEMQAAIDEYLGTTPIKTISGLAYHLGFESRQSFYDYESRPEFSYTIKRARTKIEIYYEEKLSGTTPTGPIFALKNLGWKDKQEVSQVDEDGNSVQPIININVIRTKKEIDDSL